MYTQRETATVQERERKGHKLAQCYFVQWQDTALIPPTQTRLSATRSFKVLNCTIKITFLYFIIQISVFRLNAVLSILVDTCPKKYTSAKYDITLCLAHGIAVQQCPNAYPSL